MTKTELDSYISTFVEQLGSGTWVPGQHVTEAALTEMLSISRGDVRLLFQHLETLGVVEIIKHKGCLVRRYSSKEIHDFFLIRESLEGLAASLAAENFSRSTLDDCVQTLRAACTDQLEGDFRTSNKALHQAIVRLSDNAPLQQTIHQLQIPLLRAQFRASVNERYIADSSQEHQAIAQAICAGNAAEAERAMRIHIQGARLRIEGMALL